VRKSRRCRHCAQCSAAARCSDRSSFSSNKVGTRVSYRPGRAFCFTLECSQSSITDGGCRCDCVKIGKHELQSGKGRHDNGAKGTHLELFTHCLYKINIFTL
jgi:hypothetical protein